MLDAAPHLEGVNIDLGRGMDWMLKCPNFDFGQKSSTWDAHSLYIKCIHFLTKTMCVWQKSIEYSSFDASWIVMGMFCTKISEQLNVLVIYYSNWERQIFKSNEAQKHKMICVGQHRLMINLVMKWEWLSFPVPTWNLWWLSLLPLKEYTYLAH